MEIQPDLELIRHSYTPQGTFGALVLPEFDLVTVERPWIDNRRNISCIPEGVYVCRPRWYFRGGYEAVEILNVAHRSHILFHKGNTLHDVAGCIALATKLGVVNGLWAGVGSEEAFDLFMEIVGGREWCLRISQYRPAQMEQERIH